MTKKVLICLAVLLLGMSSYLAWQSWKEQSVPNSRENQEELIKAIFREARFGKIPGAPLIAGKSSLQEVDQLWGDPDQIDGLAAGIYQQYQSPKVTLGLRADRVVDIRSYAPELNFIRLETIEKLKGEPDEVRYYQDKNVDQVILVYNVSKSEQLKWILPKPTKSVPNPAVDHISLYSDSTKIIKEQKGVNNQLKAMNIREKIGQMIFAGTDGVELDAGTKELITHHQVGGFIFFAANLLDTKQMITLLNDIKRENVQNPFPLFLGVDQEGGRISRFPDNMMTLPTNEEIGMLNDVAFSYEVGQVLGDQVKAFGFNLDFAPVLDVNSNPNNPVINDRSFGSDPQLVSRLGIETMKGIQSQQIISVIKHFPGHGDTEVDSHLDLPIIEKSVKEMEQIELLPFYKAIHDGADMVMVAHILLPEIDPTYPSSMSKKVITNLLRDRLDFTGVVVTDDMTMKAITNHYEMGEAAVQSVKAGSDVILIAHEYDNVKNVIEALVQAVETGELSEERIDESVRRILQLKKKYNLEDQPVEKVDVESLNHSIEEVLEKYSEE
ncbi:beta-N-acetylhexosaminidase [Lederbergia galactosidilytica]|uniref:beta-N-acetylhexosaminidase n=1 Tax=Lederbergia galactosidilytica TaxID=217031 RepID=A0A177ZNH5_9BACI|nr:beta-N-acetylhexosaminidase [Lederbergia galactosidilytica]KRG14874.1 beta-hexosaminidase [Virgibacillus soli]MBP1914553.1 beta-N-acetylhexosaminidase [Lederbergia galactosidilytica]OAK69123.1 beta-hexosaminidase [Lederbergia galactosidilytica]